MKINFIEKGNIIEMAYFYEFENFTNKQLKKWASDKMIAIPWFFFLPVIGRYLLKSEMVKAYLKFNEVKK